MQIHIQFHGSESTQNSLNPATEKHMEVQRCDRLDKMIQGCRTAWVVRHCWLLVCLAHLRPTILQRNIDQESFSRSVRWTTLTFSNVRALIFRKEVSSDPVLLSLRLLTVRIYKHPIWSGVWVVFFIFITVKILTDTHIDGLECIRSVST